MALQFTDILHEWMQMKAVTGDGYVGYKEYCEEHGDNDKSFAIRFSKLEDALNKLVPIPDKASGVPND